MRCWLLLCSDLAIRSGTAARLTPNHYDPQTRMLTFATKYDAHQRLPVTDELARILGQPGLAPDVPYVAQLSAVNRNKRGEFLNRNSMPHALRRLRRALGITRKLTAHDFRRTTATRVYDQTGDLRIVQAVLGHGDLNSTLWYLDHHITKIPVAELELAKLNPRTEAIQ
jgi:integrase